MDPFVILGVDPSLRWTGYVLRSTDSGVALEHGRLWSDSSTSSARVLARLSVFFREVASRYRPSLCAIEGYSFGASHSSGFAATVEAGGAIKAAVAASCPYVEIPAMTWKSVVMGRAWVRAKKQTKADAAAYLARFYEIGGDRVIKNVDEADAWMIAECLVRHIDGRADYTTDGARHIMAQVGAVWDAVESRPVRWPNVDGGAWEKRKSGWGLPGV